MKKILFIISVLVFCSLNYVSLTYAYDRSESDISLYNVSGSINAAPGETAVIIIKIDIPEKNYIYANPKGNGIGKATEVTVESNSSLQEWKARYPAGKKYQAKGDPDTVNIYRKSVRLPVAFTLKKNIPYGKLPIKLNISALMCSSESCIPFEKSIDVAVSVIKTAGLASPEMEKNINEFLSIKNNTRQTVISEKRTSRNDNISTESGIPENIQFKPVYSGGEITGLFKAILFGLIAGFILNFMPCVLPVVSLKIMSFVMNAGERRSVIATQGAVFSAGIIVSFLVLAALASFSGHKWGELFQSRLFIIVMTAFIFSMALSLFGVFTLNAPLAIGRAVTKKRNIYADAFIKGAAATLLATPCSGPFLGGTLAWTLTMPPSIIFVIFLSIGTGMALPYLLLAFNPSLIRFVPKSGTWMNYFETAMGFLLLFTVVYLASIIEGNSRTALMLFLLFISIGLWQYGKFGSVENNKKLRIISFIIMLCISLGGYFLSFNYIFSVKEFPHERTVYSAEKLLSNRDHNIITVVEFTADWCPNCSLVEKLALEKNGVQKLFARNDVEFMIADITNKNPQAESLMRMLGSKSIPLLAIFPPGTGFGFPLCLRDLYSEEDVIQNIESAEKYFTK